MNISYEDIKKMSECSYDQFHWFNHVTKLKKSEAKYQKLITKVIFKHRINGILYLRYNYPQSLPSYLTNEAILNELELKEKSLAFIKPMYYQSAKELISNNIKMPDNLTNYIEQYFSDNNNDIIFFSFVSLPSAYGFYLIPDIVDRAVDLAINSLRSSMNTFADHFASSFYLYNTQFISKLWKEFSHRIRKANRKLPVFAIFMIFCESLQSAVNYLKEYHFRIAKEILRIGFDRFIHIYVDLIFIPTLKMHIENDPTMKFSDFCGNLYVAFDQVKKMISQESLTNFMPPISFLIRILCDHESRKETCPSFSDMDLKCYYTFLSMHELKLFANMILYKDDKKTSRIYLLDDSELGTFFSGKLDIYINNIFKSRDNSEFDLFDEKCPVKFNREKESYIMNFLFLENMSHNKDYPIIHFLDPSMVTYVPERQFIDGQIYQFPLMSDKKFKEYSYMKILKQNCEKIMYLNLYLRITFATSLMKSIDDLEVFENAISYLSVSELDGSRSHPQLSFLYYASHLSYVVTGEYLSLMKKFEEAFELMKDVNVGFSHFEKIKKNEHYQVEIASIKSQAEIFNTFKVRNKFFAYPLIFNRIDGILNVLDQNKADENYPQNFFSLLYLIIIDSCHQSICSALTIFFSIFKTPPKNEFALKIYQIWQDLLKSFDATIFEFEPNLKQEFYKFCEMDL